MIRLYTGVLSRRLASRGLDTMVTNCGWHAGWLISLVGLVAAACPARAEDVALARKAREILQANCHRCHGQEGAVEGGMNYILDRDKLVARKRIVPGDAAGSALYKRVAAGKMPPPSEKVR